MFIRVHTAHNGEVRLVNMSHFEYAKVGEAPWDGESKPSVWLVSPTQATRNFPVRESLDEIEALLAAARWPGTTDYGQRWAGEAFDINPDADFIEKLRAVIAATDTAG